MDVGIEPDAVLTPIRQGETADFLEEVPPTIAEGDSMRWTYLFLSFAIVNLSSVGWAQVLRSDETVDWSSNTIDIETDLSKQRVEFRGVSQAIILDLGSHQLSRISLSGADDVAVPENINPPMNDVAFTLPVNPADLRFGMMQSNVGSCSATYIGKRYFLTAGHCLYGGSWPAWVHIVPGFDNGKSSYRSFNARRLFAFNGYIDGNDAAHDVAVIEVDRDLPAGVAPVPVRSPHFSCVQGQWSNISFNRYF